MKNINFSTSSSFADVEKHNITNYCPSTAVGLTLGQAGSTKNGDKIVMCPGTA